MSSDNSVRGAYAGEEGSYLLARGVQSYVSPTQESKFNVCGVVQIFFYPALGGLLFGYDIGATSAIILQIRSADKSGVLWYQAVDESSVLQGVITSMSMFGALVGCLICLRFADSIGRRGTLLLAAVCYFFGAIIEGLSGFSTWDAETGISVLVLGRVIYGLGIGFAMQGAPAYIGEMSPPSIRGLLVSLKECFIVLGMLLGYSLGEAYSRTAGGWRLTYAWATVAALPMFCGMYSLPCSAPWLAMHGRVPQALQALRFVTPRLSTEQVRQTVEQGIKGTADAAERGKHSMYDIWRQLSSPAVYPALVAGVGLVVFQQITGQPSVLYFIDTLLADIGVSLTAAIAISFFKLVATLTTAFLVDNYGRKRLLNIGCTMMLVALIALAIAFSQPYSNSSDCNAHTTLNTCPNTCAWDDRDVQCRVDPACAPAPDETCTCCAAKPMDFQKAVMLLSLLVYIGGYQIGFGPIVWLFISELFPLKVRGRAVAVAVVTNFFLSTVVALLLPVELHVLGAAFTFFIYAILMIACLIFVYTCVPETKGMSLDDIEQSYAANAAQILPAGQVVDVENAGTSERTQSHLMPLI